MWIDDIAKDVGLRVEFGAYNSIAGVAVFNKEHTERYILEKRWAKGDKIFLAFLMNPSKASFDTSDRTVTLMIELAKKHQCDALYVVNISSVIDDDAEKLATAGFHLNKTNLLFIQEAFKHAHILFLGWGLNGQKIMKQNLAELPDFRSLLEEAQSKLYAYEVIESPKEKEVYIPLPRNKNNFKKYVEHTAVKITKEQFNELFN